MIRSTIKIFALLSVMSCTHTEPAKTTEWAPAKNAPIIPCRDWPMQANELSVDNIYLSSIQDASYAVSQHRTRKNLRNYYLVTLDSKFDLDKNQLKPFKLPEEESINSFAQLGRVGALVTEKDSNEAVIRNVEKNAVIAQMKLPGEAYNMALSGNKIGFWLQHQKPDDDHFFIQKLELKKSPSLGSTITAESKPKVIELGSAAFAVWSSKGKLFLQSLVSGKAIPILNTSENIESWDLINVGNTLLVALVDGDSQVEGVSKLHIYSYSFSPKKVKQNWKKIIDMNDRHLAKPIWQGGKNPVLNISHWIDGEALLTRYFVDPSKGISKTLDAGVLQSNQHIIGFVAPKTAGRTRFLTRSKGKNFWKFQVCEL